MCSSTPHREEYRSLRKRAEAKTTLPLTMASDSAAPITPQEEDFIVTIEKVAGKINYSKLIDRFGSSPIPPSLIERVERLTKRPAHPFLKRGFFFSHRYGLYLPMSFTLIDPHWKPGDPSQG
jgi:tryptophanyl-tRNA synthetase